MHRNRLPRWTKDNQIGKNLPILDNPPIYQVNGLSSVLHLRTADEQCLKTQFVECKMRLKIVCGLNVIR